jgi:hypothetical protein
LALLWRYCGAMGGGGGSRAATRVARAGRQWQVGFVGEKGGVQSSAKDKSTAGGSDGLTTFTHGRRCLARARARASTCRSGMDDRYPTDQDGQARPRRDQRGSVAARLLDGRSDGDLHYEGRRRGDRQHA